MHDYSESDPEDRCGCDLVIQLHYSTRNVYTMGINSCYHYIYPIAKTIVYAVENSKHLHVGLL